MGGEKTRVGLRCMPKIKLITTHTHTDTRTRAKRAWWVGGGKGVVCICRPTIFKNGEKSKINAWPSGWCRWQRQQRCFSYRCCCPAAPLLPRCCWQLHAHAHANRKRELRMRRQQGMLDEQLPGFERKANAIR